MIQQTNHQKSTGQIHHNEEIDRLAAIAACGCKINCLKGVSFELGFAIGGFFGGNKNRIGAHVRLHFADGVAAVKLS